MGNSESEMMVMPSSDKPTRSRSWGGVVAAIGIWSFWAVLPAALLEDSGTRAAAAAQLGPSSVAYLQAAPHGLCWYLILGQYVTLPALVALSSSLRRPAARAESGVQAIRQWARALLPFLGWWSVLYFAGNALVAISDLRHGAALEVVRGYALYLSLYGLLATLPIWGFVFACRVVIWRFWLSALVSVVSSAFVAVSALVIGARHYQFPTSGVLRGQLLSGLPEQVAHAELGCLLWSLGFALFALGVLLLPTFRRHRLPSEPHGAA